MTSYLLSYKEQNPLKFSGFMLKRVELAGIEPASKQGNHTLSTRLFQPLIFVLWQDLDHQPQPYPLNFHLATEALQGYSRFTCTAWPKNFGTTAFERCLVPLPSSGIEPVTYCDSVRQRERNYFRQLICWQLGFRSQLPTLRVLTYHSNPLSNPVNPLHLLHNELCAKRLKAIAYQRSENVLQI